VVSAAWPSGPQKILTDLVALALGGDCLADVAVLRAQPELCGPVASFVRGRLRVGPQLLSVANCRELVAPNRAAGDGGVLGWLPVTDRGRIPLVLAGGLVPRHRSWSWPGRALRPDQPLLRRNERRFLARP
jgi:hypothetical protein